MIKQWKFIDFGVYTLEYNSDGLTKNEYHANGRKKRKKKERNKISSILMALVRLRLSHGLVGSY